MKTKKNKFLTAKISQKIILWMCQQCLIFVSAVYPASFSWIKITCFEYACDLACLNPFLSSLWLFYISFKHSILNIWKHGELRAIGRSIRPFVTLIRILSWGKFCTLNYILGVKFNWYYNFRSFKWNIKWPRFIRKGHKICMIISTIITATTIIIAMQNQLRN